MYAQVSTAKLQPDRIDDWITATRDSILPAARQVQGFRGAYLLVDRERNKGIGISLWESEADVAAVATSGFYKEQVAKVTQYLAGPPEREVYEVALQP